jgi:hypothetical protein
LPEKKFDVKAIDQNGNVMIDATITTLRNGFFELWLPRNHKAELIIRGLNRSARGTIETFDNRKTCVTTFQLK